jgi:DNA-binding CsgD family transcriptional regulator
LLCLGTKYQMKEIKPITPDEFIDKLQAVNSANTIDYQAYFKTYIEQAINFAIAPYCWYIPDARVMKIVAVSDNIRQLTPFTKQEWIGQGVDFLANNIHPDDCNYVLSATAMAAGIQENLPVESRGSIRINIYGRMLDANRNYRWTLIQYPGSFFNEEGKIESTLSLMTDLSHFNLIETPMMTVIDNSNTQHQYFKVTIDTKQLTPLLVPHITKREQEVLQLMIKGMNTPAIVKQLNIAYDTVENHKRNLRKKTNTKTSAELVHYMMTNNLL